MPMYYQFHENCIENKQRIDIKSAIEQLTIPQLIVHGSDDPTVQLAEAKNLKRWNNSAQLSIIKGANHVFGGVHPFDLDEFPPHLNEAIDITINFLKK